VVERLENRQLLSTTNPLPVTTFGTGGTVSGAFTGYAAQDAIADAVQSDGKLIVVGDASPAGKNKSAFIARFNTNGTIDKTFGTNGVTFLTYGAGGDTIFTNVKIQTNGSIVVAGVENTNSSNYSALVARFTNKGKFDTTFATTGKKLLNFGSASEATGLLIQSNGKIDVIGGAASIATLSGGAAIAQLNANGTLDTTFNHTGMLVTSPGTFNVEIGSCGVWDGDLYIGGASLALGFSGFSGAQAEIIAVKPNGTLDTAFGTAGRAKLSFGQSFEFITSIGVDPISKNLYVGGTSANGAFAFGTPLPVGSTGGSSAAAIKPAIALPSFSAPAATKAGFAAARVNLKGGLDKTFNSKGWIYVSFGANTLAGSSSMVILNNGQIVLTGGEEINHGNSQVVMIRLTQVGKMDLSFGMNGIYSSATSGRSTGFFDMAIVPHLTNGKVDYYFCFCVGHSKLLGKGNYLIVELKFTLPN